MQGFFSLSACVLPLKYRAKTALSKHVRRRGGRVFLLYSSNMFFRTVFMTIQGIQGIDERRKNNNHWKPSSQNVTRYHFQNCAHMQRRYPANLFSVTRICQFLNTCMWNGPQSMLNVSEHWWREEISWLSHVVAYYPSNQAACARRASTSAANTDIYGTPQLCH